MISTRLAYSAILALLLMFLVTPALALEDDDYEDDYDVKARVVRISLLNGEVTLKRSDSEEWENARLNYPLVEGDSIRTDSESHAEVQIDSKNFLRLGANSILKIVTLRDEGIALSLSEGTVSLRLAQFDRDRESFEIDAPGSTVAIEQIGLYRIDIEADQLRISVREGGQARIYSPNSGFLLRDGRLARLDLANADADWELMAALDGDSFDNWVTDREQQLAQTFHYNSPYYDNQIWGAEDLDNYGNWAYANDYGWVWRPHVTVINNYTNWAPYRYGHWTWLPPYGWSWVGYEPWGWAPYHYGRWVYYNNYWAWCPRSHYYRQRSWWRPALVAFVSVNNSFGPQIYWYPLSFRQRDPQSRHYRGHQRGWQLPPAYLRAVTGLHRGDFGRRNPGWRSADETIARGVAGQNPLRDLGFRPERRRNPEGVDRNRGDSPWRRTGATVRRPGTPLNDELRRTRLWNGREPRTFTRGESTRPTGVVSRPRDRGGRGERDNASSERLPGKVRMAQPDSPASDKPSETPRRFSGGSERQNPPAANTGDRPSRTRPFSRPEPSPPTETRQPIQRPVQREKIQPSTPSTAAPEKPSTPRSEPAPRNDKPAERSQPSPRRAEPPPQRVDPPPQRSESRRERPSTEADKVRRESRVERKNEPQ